MVSRKLTKMTGVVRKNRTTNKMKLTSTALMYQWLDGTDRFFLK
jgi:hypothetical protein